MRDEPDVASVAALIGDPSRTAMLAALADGRALPAGELAAAAGLSLSGASAQLARLTQGGLLTVEREGRHRYYRLAGPQVAAAPELALQAGFRSLRRFNAVFVEVYKKSPTKIRLFARANGWGPPVSCARHKLASVGDHAVGTDEVIE